MSEPRGRSPKLVQEQQNTIEALEAQLKDSQARMMQMNEQFQNYVNGEQRQLRMGEVGALQTIADAMYLKNREAIDAFRQERLAAKESDSEE